MFFVTYSLVSNLVKVFVYGTLKPGESNYELFCADQLVAVQRAIAIGQLFALPMGYPAMTNGNATVQGFLLTFKDPGILVSLDELEDYYPDRPAEQNEYERQQIEIYDLDRQLLGTAWAYLMTPQQVRYRGGVLLPNGWWGSR